jgi:hypothetical protein
MRPPRRSVMNRYRIWIGRDIDREPLPTALVERLFIAPHPRLEWTGNGVHRDEAGRSHFVRHAMATTSQVDRPEDVIALDVPKMLILEQLRTQSVAEFLDWLVRNGGPNAAIADSHIDRLERAFVIGDQIVFGYDPRRHGTAMVWPWTEGTLIAGADFMHATWSCFFGQPPSSELPTQLLRWTKRL